MLLELRRRYFSFVVRLGRLWKGGGRVQAFTYCRLAGLGSHIRVGHLWLMPEGQCSGLGEGYEVGVLVGRNDMSTVGSDMTILETNCAA